MSGKHRRLFCLVRRARPAGITLLAVLTAAMLLLCAACGSDDEATGSGDDGGDTPAATTPQEIGDQVVAVYNETMDEVVSLMQDRPDAATLTQQLEKLKAQAIEKLVALGKQREALDEASRAESDAVVRSGLAAVPPGVYDTYAEGQSYYLSQDMELGDLIADFNIITQYADYDLLRQQEPEEAERLGL